MVVASSVSTYLDVTQAARGAVETSSAPAADTEAAGKVLATIHNGVDVVAEIPAKSGLSTEQVLALVAWLSQAGLITLDSSDGTMRAQLTEPARAALTVQ